MSWRKPQTVPTFFEFLKLLKINSFSLSLTFQVLKMFNDLESFELCDKRNNRLRCSILEFFNSLLKFLRIRSRNS